MSAITITDDGLNLWRNAAKGADNPIITYVSFGSSNTSPSTSDHKLGNETFRKAVTSYTNVTTGELIITMYCSPNDGVGNNVQEVGFWGGNTATSTKDSGVMFARGLFTHNPKTNVESIQFSLDLTAARG